MTEAKECRGKKKDICPFLLLENSRALSPLREPQTPFSSWGTPDLSTCLGIDSLSPILKYSHVGSEGFSIWILCMGHSSVHSGQVLASRERGVLTGWWSWKSHLSDTIRVKTDSGKKLTDAKLGISFDEDQDTLVLECLLETLRNSKGKIASVQGRPRAAPYDQNRHSQWRTGGCRRPDGVPSLSLQLLRMRNLAFVIRKHQTNPRWGPIY